MFSEIEVAEWRRSLTSSGAVCNVFVLVDVMRKRGAMAADARRKLTMDDVRAAADRLVAPALPVTGAVGSPVNPLAIH